MATRLMILTDDIEGFRKAKWKKVCIDCNTASGEIIDGVELERLMESNEKWWCPVCKKEVYPNGRRV